MGAEPFTWRDGERVIRFGRGVSAEAVELAGGPGFALLTTARASAALPGLAEAAAEVHEVPAGQVDAVADELRGRVDAERIVALGGGRVVDVAKAVAAAGAAAARGAAGPGAAGRLDAPADGRLGAPLVVAVPTTLSGAEMSRRHRHARGVDPATPHVRPVVVICDPALAASQPEAELAASACNALGHAAEAPCTRRANPVSTLAALEAARLLVGAFGRPGRDGGPDRDALALGALLAGYAIDSAGLGLHHVLAQTLAREAGAPHARANAVMLPQTLGALAWRFPGSHARLAEVLGEDPAEAAARLAARSGTTRLRDLGIPPEVLPACADAAAARDDLDMTPPRADRAEVLVLYEAAA